MSAPLSDARALTRRVSQASQYELLARIATGGMATVFMGRLSSSMGISRLFAIKRPHAHLVEDPRFVEMLIAEANVACRIHHANVVAVQSVETVDGHLSLIMDYVEGASVAELCGKWAGSLLPAAVALRIVIDACAGLHAAHLVEGDDGRCLGVVHRDISPQNILVGVDGGSRVTDFGIARISSAHRATRTGRIFGKAPYMAPEYIASGNVDRRGDIFALGVVAWEMLAGQRLFLGPNEFASLQRVREGVVPSVRDFAPSLPFAIDAVLARALERNPHGRYQTAQQFASALESCARDHGLVASQADVGACVRLAVGPELAWRRTLLREHGDASAVPARARDTITGVMATELASGAGPLAPGRDPTALMSVLTVQHSESLEIPGVSPSRSRARARAAVIFLAAASLGSAVVVVRDRRPAAVEPTASAPSDPSRATPPSESSAANSALANQLARADTMLNAPAESRHFESAGSPSATTPSFPTAPPQFPPAPARTHRTREPGRAGAPLSATPSPVAAAAPKSPAPAAVAAAVKPLASSPEEARDKAPPNPYEP